MLALLPSSAGAQNSGSDQGKPGDPPATAAGGNTSKKGDSSGNGSDANGAATPAGSGVPLYLPARRLERAAAQESGAPFAWFVLAFFARRRADRAQADELPAYSTRELDFWSRRGWTPEPDVLTSTRPTMR
jgi:hypothetical protein